MIKTILVPATGSTADNSVFASALAVARAFAAHLEFLHVRVDAASMAVTMSSEGGGATMVGGLVERLDEEAERREMRARRLFDEFCAREGVAITDTPPGPAAPSAQWTRQIGPEPYWVVEHGRAADLMVMGRAADGEGVAPETIETALLDSGRPVFIPPASPMTALPLPFTPLDTTSVPPFSASSIPSLVMVSVPVSRISGLVPVASIAAPF